VQVQKREVSVARLDEVRPRGTTCISPKCPTSSFLNALPAAHRVQIPKRFQRDLACPVLACKISRYACRANHLYKLAPSHPKEGRLAIVTNARWDAVDAAASARLAIAGQVSPVSERSARGRTALQRLRQNLGGRHMAGRSVWRGGCVRRSRVVLASVADVKLAEAKPARPGTGRR
jgi:hypothetical protein